MRALETTDALGCLAKQIADIGRQNGSCAHHLEVEKRHRCPYFSLRTSSSADPRRKEARSGARFDHFKVLTVEELTAFFAAIRKPKYRALFMTCYAAGLRLGEACQLRVEDIDSQRMVIRVRAGKGGRERLTVLSPRLLEVLRTYWRLAKPSVWLFPGATPARPVAIDTARSVFHRARVQAGLPPEPWTPESCL
jgi:integrase